MTGRCEHLEDVAAWTLGALDDVEAQRFAGHLDRCDACRGEVELLTPAAEVLAMTAPQLEPSAALRDRIMDAVGVKAERAPRRRLRVLAGRPALAAALACGLVAAGVTAGVVIDGGDDGPSTKTVDAVAHDGMTAIATVNADHVTLRIDGMKTPPVGRVYQVWLQRDGKVVPTRTLFAPSGGTAVVTVGEALDGADRVMISDEEMGGSPVPTGEVYVDARLS